MYKYSPVQELKVRNFRNLGDIVLSFKESPIITLVGDNEAGKTSIVKAFATCALHASPREQLGYIRDFTDMFGVEIDLEDGTKIVRCKNTSGEYNLYTVIYPDGKSWSVNKITNGLPAEVSKVMGLIEEPETGEFLHVRTYEDKLLFVVTPSSTNYKVMYNALKVEQLTKAMKIGSLEVNNLKGAISNNEVSISTLGNQLRSIGIVNIEPAVEIKNRLKYQIKVLERIESAKEKLDRLVGLENKMGAYSLLDVLDIKQVDEILASRLYNASKILNNITDTMSNLKVVGKVDGLCEINSDLALRVINAKKKMGILNEKIKYSSVLDNVYSIFEISDSLIKQLYRAESLDTRLKALCSSDTSDRINMCDYVEQSNVDIASRIYKVICLENSIDTKTKEIVDVDAIIEQGNEYMKQCGIAVETCSKCGETVVFDMDKIL